jgi:hypothetical protein
LAANTARLQGDLGKAVNVVSATAEKFKKAFEFLGVATGGGLFAETIKSSIEFGDQIQKGAERAGIAAGKFSELAAAAKQTDVDVDTLSKGLKDLGVSISKASTGDKTAGDLFRALGLNIKDLKALQPEAQLGLVASRLKEIESPADRARVGTELLGKSYLALVPLLAGGAEGIRKLVEEQQRLGNTFSDEQIQRLSEADESIKRLTASWHGFGTTLATIVAPPLTATLNFLAGDLDHAQKLALARVQLAKLQGENDDPTAREALETEIDQLTKLVELDRQRAVGAGGSPNGRRRANNIDMSQIGKDAIDGLDYYYAKSKRGTLDELLNSYMKNTRTQVEVTADAFGETQAQLGVLLDTGRIDAHEYAVRYNEALDDILTGVKVTAKQGSVALTEMSEFAKEAASNMQYGFEQFLFDPFSDGLKGLLKGFVDTLRQMVAQAAAAKVFDALTAGAGGGGLGGFLGSILGAVSGAAGGPGSSGVGGGLSGVAGARAAGGPVAAGMAYLVGERGPEIFRPNSSGAISPNGAGGITITNNIDARGATTDLVKALPAILDQNQRQTLARVHELIRGGAYA